MFSKKRIHFNNGFLKRIHFSNVSLTRIHFKNVFLKRIHFNNLKLIKNFFFTWKAFSIDFRLSFMAAVTKPLSGVQGSLTFFKNEIKSDLTILHSQNEFAKSGTKKESKILSARIYQYRVQKKARSFKNSSFHVEWQTIQGYIKF